MAGLIRPQTFYFYSKRSHKSYWGESVRPNGKVVLLSDDGVSVGKTTVKYLKRNYEPDAFSTYGEHVSDEQFWKDFDVWYFLQSP